MTLLANEATADSRKILKKYGKADAKSCGDLEVKLAELYYSAPDKKMLEKELADIHPHTKWILKNYPQTTIKEQAEKDISNIEEGKAEVLSNACGCSSFDGKLGAVETAAPATQRQFTPIDYIGMISALAVIGLTFYVVIKR